MADDMTQIRPYPPFTISAEVAAHIGRWDPARVLAEVTAKRSVLDTYEHARGLPEDGPGKVGPRRPGGGRAGPGPAVPGAPGVPPGLAAVMMRTPPPAGNGALAVVPGYSYGLTGAVCRAGAPAAGAPPVLAPVLTGTRVRTRHRLTARL